MRKVASAISPLEEPTERDRRAILRLIHALTLSGMGGGRPFRPPLSDNRDFSGNEPPLDLRPVCKFEFVDFDPVENKTEHSIFLGLIVAARRSSRIPFFLLTSTWITRRLLGHTRQHSYTP